METKTFEAGQIIFREGDDSQEAFRIISGVVDVSIRTPYGPRSLAQLHDGEIFGEMGLVDDKPRSATAKALEDAEVEVITEGNFEEAVLSQPERLHGYLSTLFERLRTTDTMLQMAIKRNPDSAVAKKAEVSPSMETALYETIETGDDEGGGAAGVENLHVRVRSDYEKSGWRGDPIDTVITKFPFRIGRMESAPAGGVPFASNDLMIPDGVPYQVSRNHCVIEKHGNHLVLRDRGSTVGTIVNGQTIGLQGDEIAARLNVGENEVILGSAQGPQHFRVTLTAG